MLHGTIDLKVGTSNRYFSIYLSHLCCNRGRFFYTRIRTDFNLKIWRDGCMRACTRICVYLFFNISPSWRFAKLFPTSFLSFKEFSDYVSGNSRNSLTRTSLSRSLFRRVRMPLVIHVRNGNLLYVISWNKIHMRNET